VSACSSDLKLSGAEATGRHSRYISRFAPKYSEAQIRHKFYNLGAQSALSAQMHILLIRISFVHRDLVHGRKT
jgi:hypothetical protein